MGAVRLNAARVGRTLDRSRRVCSGSWLSPNLPTCSVLEHAMRALFYTMLTGIAAIYAHNVLSDNCTGITMPSSDKRQLG